MSMLCCEICNNPVDTDWDLDGVWTKTGYICESCAETARFKNSLNKHAQAMYDLLRRLQKKCTRQSYPYLLCEVDSLLIDIDYQGAEETEGER